MNFGVWQGENRSDTSRYREDFQRREAPKGTGLLIQTCGTSHSRYTADTFFSSAHPSVYGRRSVITLPT
jgi:hypothetical protein